MEKAKERWTPLHGLLLTDILQGFQKENIKYFILRNYEDLPEKNRGKDVDIVIEPGRYKNAGEVILECMRKHGLRYYTITQFDRMRCWYIMDIGKRFAIHLDIIENEVYKGFEFYSFSKLYSHTRLCNGIRVLDPVFDTMLLLIQNLVAYKTLKPRYQKTIERNYSDYKKEIDREILEFWGEREGLLLTEYLTRKDFRNIIRMAPDLGMQAVNNIFRNNPCHTVRNILRFIAGKAYRILWCPRKFWRFIAVEAPDGTGKTSFINNLVKELEFYYVQDENSPRFQIHHFRPSLLPNLGAAGEKMGVMKQDRDFTSPHRAQPAGRLSSLLRITYYWLDYLIGIPYLLRKEVQYEKYTVFDRYIYDFIIDPQRSRINLPDNIRKAFARMVIQPRIVFVLEADAETIFQRKQELTKEEIVRQLEEFNRLCSFGKQFVKIDANGTQEQMVQQAICILFNEFMNKTR